MIVPILVLGGAAALFFLARRNAGGIAPSSLPAATTNALNQAVSEPSFANLSTAHALLVQTANLNEPQAQQAMQVLKNLASQQQPKAPAIRSGNVALVQQLVSLFDDGAQMIDVFEGNGGTRILRYRFDVPTGQRSFVVKGPAVPDSLVQQAAQALGIPLPIQNAPVQPS